MKWYKNKKLHFSFFELQDVTIDKSIMKQKLETFWVYKSELNIIIV